MLAQHRLDNGDVGQVDPSRIALQQIDPNTLGLAEALFGATAIAGHEIQESDLLGTRPCIVARNFSPQFHCIQIPAFGSRDLGADRLASLLVEQAAVIAQRRAQRFGILLEESFDAGAREI